MTDTAYNYYAATEDVFNLSDGAAIYGIRIYRRRAESNGKGTKVGLMIGSDLPGLLRSFAAFYEQEGGWEGVVAAMEKAER